MWLRAGADSTADKADLRGADRLVELGDGLVTPGSSWRLHCEVHEHVNTAGWDGQSKRFHDDERHEFQHVTANLGEALDLLARWAEQLPTKFWRGTDTLGGAANLCVLEPGQDDGAYIRTPLLQVGTGAERGLDAVIAMLDALCGEAEQRYEGGHT